MPRVIARVAGLFYLLVFITGGLAFAAAGRFVVKGDPAATATNILTHESAFLGGCALMIISAACYVVVTALFYELFKPVNQSISISAALVSVVGCAMGGVSAVFQLAALSSLKAGQPQLAYALLRSNVDSVGLVFFGFYCLQIGYLVYRSTFLPRIVGAGMVIAGLGWLTFLWAPLARSLAPFNMMPGLFGEGLLTLWLLFVGVRTKAEN